MAVVSSSRVLAGSLWVAVLGSACPSPSIAEGAPDRPVVVAASEQLEAVVVTGEKRSRATAGVLGELKLIDTPFAITVLPREVLDLQQASFYGDYLKNDPSVTIGNVPVGFTTLRGFAVGTGGYLYDGIAGAPGLSDGRNQIEGVDRIEVLKGPSAFLFGPTASSSVGGALNYVPKRPGDSAVREVALNYSNNSLYGATADFGDRFGPGRAFGYRINVGYKNGETPVDDYGWRHRAVAAAFDWRVAPGLVINAGIEYASNDFPRLQPFYVLSPGLDVPRAPDAKRSLAQPWDDFGVTNKNYYLRADWAFLDDWSVTAQGLSGHQRRKRTDEARFGFILDGAGDFLQFASRDEYRNDQATAQVVVNGDVATGPLSHHLTLGGNIQSSRAFSGSSSQGASASNLYAPTSVPQPANVDVAVGRSQSSPVRSFFASDIVTLTSQWSILAGLRHTNIRNDSFDVTTDQRVLVNETSKNAPIGSIAFKPAANALLYATYAEGLEQGGVAPAGAVNANRTLPAIVSRQAELGAKLDAAGVTYTAAVFNLRRPQEFVDPNTRVYGQGGQERHRGLEFTAYGRVTPALLLVGGFMLLRTDVKGTGDPATEGRHPLGVAPRTANLFVDYRIGSLLPGLFVNAGLYAVGPQYLDAQNRQRVAGYARIDAGVRYETWIGGVKTALLAGVENLANRSYWSGGQSGILTLADPLTVKATLRADF